MNLLLLQKKGGSWPGCYSTLASSRRLLRAETREGGVSGVAGCVVEFFLNSQQLVVLGDALRPGGGAGLDLSGVGCHRNVGDGGVLGFPGPVGGDGRVACPL